jgi:hypothetical protein
MEKFRVILDLYQLGCITLFGYMAYLMCRQYIGNQDSSQVSYKKFESGDQGDGNAYPTFSICTPHSDGAVFYPLVDTELYAELYHHPTCTNTSEKPHHWCEIGLYQNMLLGNQEITHTASSQNFDAITNSLLPHMERWLFMENNGGWYAYDKKSMYLSHQDSYRICFSKEMDPGKGRNHTYDLYAIKSFEMNFDFPLEIYVHQAGRLIEQLGKNMYCKLRGLK